MERLSIRLLGGFQVKLDGVLVQGFKSDKARALLAFLAVEAERSHARDSLAWLLWPDSPNQQARTNLRSVISNLRKVIDFSTPSQYLIINRETIQFDKNSDHWLDVASCGSSFAETRINPSNLETNEKAVALYSGPFLSGFSISDSAPFEEWVVLKREQINRRMMIILSNLVAHYEMQGAFEMAQHHAWKMVELEPWNEEAHQQLMRVLALGGRRTAALNQYEACRRVLADELGVDPSRETTALYDSIRDGRLWILPPDSSMQVTEIWPETAKSGQHPFVGRQAELDRLNGFLEKTLTGNGRVVFVTGSSGSGKTALISEFFRRALQTHPNLVAAVGRCIDCTGIGDPYLPFVEIIRLLTGELEKKFAYGILPPQCARRLWFLAPTTLKALTEAGPDLINRIIPGKVLVERMHAFAQGREVWLETLIALVDNRDAVKIDAGIQQSELFEQFTRVLLTLARRQPLFLFIDDLQWADGGSINLLSYLGRRLQGSRILVIGAYRSEEVSIRKDGEQHPLEQLVLKLQREFADTGLDLDSYEGINFVDNFLDSEPNLLDLSFRQKLLQHTNGHPLFTIELLRSLQEDGGLIWNNSGYWIQGNTLNWEKLPVRVEAVIAARVGRLPQDLRRILEVASVEGEEFTAEVSAKILHQDEGFIIQQLSGQLSRVHRLVRATNSRRLNGQRISHYRFEHHLFQTYLYDTLDDVERAYLHEKVGETLEWFYQGQLEEKETVFVKLARHFHEAGHHQKTIEYLRLSGEKAERLSASEEAIVHFRNALAVCLKMTHTLDRDLNELRFSTALGAQLVATGGYLSAEAGQLYARARELCQELIERLDEPRKAALELIPVLLGLGAFYGHQAQYLTGRGIYDQIFSLAQASGDAEAMMLAHWGPGYLLINVGEFFSARDHLEKALEDYKPREHRRLITIFTLDMGVSCLSWLSWALFFLGFPDQALERSREAITLARQISHPFSLAFALTVASLLRSIARDRNGTLELVEEAIEICRTKGFLFWLNVAIAYRGLALAWQGGNNEGIAQMREGERFWRASGAIIGLSAYLIDLAEILATVGQEDEAWESLEEAFGLVDKSGELIYAAELYRIKGELLLGQSILNQDEAEDCFRTAIEIARTQQAKILELRATTSMCKLLLEEGRKEEAGELLNTVYSWFSEGFETPDLQSASILLQKLL